MTGLTGQVFEQARWLAMTYTDDDELSSVLSRLPGEPRRAWIDGEEGIDLDAILTAARGRSAPQVQS
jgi:hypothetical protein